MIRDILEIVVVLAITFAWVTGQLDPLQKKLQELLLDMIGETKLSYGIKKSLTAKTLVEDENLAKIQNQLGGDIGGVFGKGGIGHGVGKGLSKAL